jgi:glycosyltransferase involved in cell wall biosynthesis
MHILLIHQAFVSLQEPGGTRHYEIARYLAENGNRVTIIASPVSYLTGKASEKSSSVEHGGPDERITIIRTYTYSALHRSFVHRVISFFSFMISSFIAGLRVRDVDLVWGTSPPIFQGATAWALARLKRVPFLFEVRDLWPAFAIGVGVLHNKILIGASEWLERFLYRHADVVMVNSPGFIHHVKSRGAEKTELVPNGSDPQMFNLTDDGRDFRKSHGFIGKYIALYAGAHGMSNDLGVILEAAKILDDNPSCVFVLLGDGKEKLNLQEKAFALGLENVQFLPPLPKEGIALALAAADTCIAILKPIPLYATVYPNKVFDYMAAGKPVILAIDGVIRDVVEEADAGIFVPPGDPHALAAAIQMLMNNPERGRQMGRNGRKLIEDRFDRAKLANKIYEIMEGMIDETNR